MHQVDVNWRPPLSATSWTPPPLLPPSLSSSLCPCFKEQMPHSCHQLSTLLTASVAHGGLPPLQPVHSRRRPVYTALIGSAPRCPHDLSFLPHFFLPHLFFLDSYFATGPLEFLPPPLLFLQQHNLFHITTQRFTEALAVGRGVALARGSQGSRDVNQFLQALFKWG